MLPRVDTLYLSMISAASDRTRAAENASKARVAGPPLSAEIQTDRWTIRPGKLKGHSGYDFIALGRGHMAGVNVFWGQAPEHGGSPIARRFKVAIGSEVLWRHYQNGGTAHSCALETLEKLERDLVVALPARSAIRVRRVDVCIDHWGYTWSMIDTQRFVCRQSLRGLEERRTETRIEDVSTYQGPKAATYYVGARGSASRYLRVYNKIAEAQNSGKLPWMEPIWRVHGWDGAATVWRAEIEHGGDWLTDHGLDTVDKLEGCERALWRRYLLDVRHTTARRTRLKRSPTSRVWTSLRGSIRNAEREAKRDQLRTAWAWQPRPARVDGDCETLSAMAAGCMRELADQLFRPENDSPEEIAAKKDALMAFMGEAVAKSEERARRRQAQLEQFSNPRPRTNTPRKP